MFAEIERDRHFELVNPLITELVERAVNLAKPHRLDNSAIIPVRDNPTSSGRPNKMMSDPDDLMKLWLKVSYLKRGIETWRQQLEKMILHCEELIQGRNYISNHGFDDSAESTSVNAIFSIDVPENTGDKSGHLDELRDLEDSGRRIHQRLVELKCEYDEKIRNCSTIEWNQIGQVDAQTNLRISKYNLDIATSTGHDSKQMRSIAVLTMIFLPATFVASLFSMSFFDLGPQSGQGKVSSWIWLYFVVTVGFTGVTVSVWYYWTKIRPERLQKRALAKEDIESQSLATTTTLVRKESAGN
ncbi:hypothetical protein VP1G_04609 [Cytospora mali]|uniref:Magnesium transport protein CorA n=1 Tax=Cytospora mali TaxID=578113 RepID=A0A194V042_CYTMA|nr:hypothetical protein VP1G_04609 [Valsa mali var. pyri (nom. inval.)]